MTFEFEPTLYAQNLEEYSSLDETEFGPDESKEEIIGKLKDISRRKKDIADVQNSIIGEYVERFETETDALDAEAAEKLYEFHETLFSDSAGFCQDVYIDIRLIRLLYDYYKDTDDTERIISLLFKGTMCEYQISYDLDQFDFLTFPQLCEKYLPDIDKLTEPQQKRLIKAYAFRIVTKKDERLVTVPDLYPIIEERIESAVEKANRGEEKITVPVQFYFSFMSLTALMFRLDDMHGKHGAPVGYNIDKDKHIDNINKCIDIVSREYKDSSTDPMRLLIMKTNLLMSRFHSDMITFDELLTGFEEIMASDDDMGSGGAAMLYAGCMYLFYLHSCSPYTRREDETKAEKMINKVVPMISDIPKQKQFEFSYQVLAFLNATSLFSSFSEFYDIVLRFTVYADKSLYVHTVMVKEISHLLLNHILDTNPGYVDGVCSWDLDYITNHREEVLDLMDQCAMCHDIGKHFLIDIVSNSSRRLTDDEYHCIKLHPENFETVWEKDHDESEKQRCIRDCALLHHRWHNGEGGYPDIPLTKNMPFADILAIADSLDAATDSIGRPYGIGKSIDDLTDEFLKMGGTRYSREIAEILAEPDIRDAVLHIITERRMEVNYRIYAFNEIDS